MWKRENNPARILILAKARKKDPRVKKGLYSMEKAVWNKEEIRISKESLLFYFSHRCISSSNIKIQWISCGMLLSILIDFYLNNFISGICFRPIANSKQKFIEDGWSFLCTSSTAQVFVYNKTIVFFLTVSILSI